MIRSPRSPKPNRPLQLRRPLWRVPLRRSGAVYQGLRCRRAQCLVEAVNGAGRDENGVEVADSSVSGRAVSLSTATTQKGPELPKIEPIFDSGTDPLVHFPLHQTTVQSWHRLLPPCPLQRRLHSVIFPNHPLPPSIRSSSLGNQILRIHPRRIRPGLLPAPSRLPLAASTPHQRLADRSGLSAVPRRSSTLLDLVSVSTDRCSAVDSRSLRSAS